jgi:RimJ/RimL family protein N-acetyltransferase
LRGLGGIRYVALAVTIGHAPARNLYRKMGFVTWGVDPAFIHMGDDYWDVEWMVLALPEHT